MSIKCIVVDDEPLAMDVLENHINRFPDVQLLKKCPDAMSALNFLHTAQVDVIFLDIQMPRLNGIGFLNSLQNPPLVVFTTAYRKYAVDGYDFNIIDFLLKPVSFERFAKTVNKIMSHTETGLPAAKDVPANTKIFLRCGTKTVGIEVSEILYIEGMKDYLKIYTGNGGMVIFKKTMQEFEKMLEGYGFIRVHKSFIIAVSHISSIERGKIKILDRYVPVGRNYQQFVTRYLSDKLLA